MPSPYLTRPPFHSPSGQRVIPALNPDTPPPPPPKPNSHEASRRATPQDSLHSTTPSQQLSQETYRDSFGLTRDNVPSSADSANAQPLIDPPTVEEGWLPDIVKDKSTVDLQSILSNPSLISSLASLHPSYDSHQLYLQSLLKFNEELSTHLHDLQSHIAEIRASTESLLLAHQSLEVSWRKKQTEMDAALAPWSPKALYQRLSAAVTEQEAICQAVEESFLEEDHQGRATEKEVTDWVRRVRSEAAKLAARREAKARWDEGRVGGWR